MRLWLSALAGLCATTPGLAQDMATDRSEFTRLENCEERDPGNLSPYLQVCPGPGGREIWMPYSEHSAALAIGPDGLDAQFDQRPPTGGLNLVIGPVIDWRFAAGATDPYAAIVRYRGMTPDYDAGTGDFTGGVTIEDNVLVVIALRENGPVSACFVAYLDALQLPHANRLAYEIAADLAPRFRCGADDVRYVDADNRAWD